MIARLAPVLAMTAVLAGWASPASALDRSGAIDVAKGQVAHRCTQQTPCTFDAKLHEGNWHVRVAYPGGHAIFVINQAGKVIGRMEGE